MDQLPRLGKRELICLLMFTCNYVASVWRGFLFLWVLGMGYVILLWHSLSLPYNYFLTTKKYKYLNADFVLSSNLVTERTKSRNRFVKVGRFWSFYDLRSYRNVDFDLYFENGAVCSA